MANVLTLEQRAHNLRQEIGTLASTLRSEQRPMTDDERARHAEASEELASVDATLRLLEAEDARTANQAGTPVDQQREGSHFDGPRALADTLLAASRFETAHVLDSRLMAASGANETVGSEGGFLVNEDVSNELLRETYQTGVLVSRVRNIAISSGSNKVKLKAVNEASRANGQRRGGINLSWDGEAQPSTDSKPAYRNIELELRKLTGLYYATEELMQDAAALQSDVEAWFREEFGYVFDDVILWGTGGAQPRGIFGSPALVTVAKETGQQADSIIAENVMQMYARHRNASRGEWYITQEAWPQIFALHLAVGTGGVPLFVPPGQLNQAPNGTLMGRPINVIEQASALGDKGDISFLDLNEYLWATKGGVQTQTSIHVKFLEGETAFRFIVRVDGEPRWNAPLTPAKGTFTTSPFVALADRA